MGGAQTWVSSYIDEQGVTVTVEVQSDDTGLRMGVVKGPISGKTFDVGSMGDVLDPIAPAAAAAMPAQVTQMFDVDFAGVEADGVTNLIVKAPVPLESDFAGFRVFLGPVNALAEQATGPVSVGRSSDTQISFTSDGSPAVLVYGFESATAISGGGMLTIGSVSQTLTSDVPAAAPPGAVFLCR